MITSDEIYAGDFIIEIYSVIERYNEIYGRLPASVGIDSKHYAMVRDSFYTCWIDTGVMQTSHGVKLREETRYNGTFISARSPNYKGE